MTTVVACGDSDVGEERGDYYQAELATQRYALPGLIVDHRGQQWNCAKKAEYQVVTKVSEPKWDYAPPEAPEPQDAAQLAHALRSTADINGYECVSEPEPETVARLLAARETDDAKVAGSSAIVDMPSLTAQPKAACCDTDERVAAGGQLVNGLLFSEHGCTAFFVHPSVAMTAAHCVYDTTVNQFLQVDEEGVRHRPRWRLAVNGPGTYYKPTCSVTRVPAAFIDAARPEEAAEHDYAFVDFSTGPTSPCTKDPEPAPMWFGTWIANDKELRDQQPWSRIGYPYSVNERGGPIAGPGLTVQWGGNAGIWISARAWEIGRHQPLLELGKATIRHTLDASDGDSGSPTLKYDSVNQAWYVVGIHHGSSRGALVDRRWNATVRDVVRANTRAFR